MKSFIVTVALFCASTLSAQEIFIHEAFDDADFANRGWYDNTNLTIDPAVHLPNSNGSVRFTYEKGTKAADGGMRRAVPETDSVYLSYWVEYSENWTGSNKPYHPHEFHFMTNLNSKWHGPSFSHLTLYIEQNEGHPLLGIQDAENIDQSQINVELTDVTESRAVAGCNGNTDGYNDDCYLGGGGKYVNGKTWKASEVWFADQPGVRYKGDWHHIEAFFKLNSIVDGKGVRDGVVRYRYDGELVIDHTDVLLRTGQYPQMKFNQFLIAPYIGDGSPIDQSMWVDELIVGTGPEMSRVKLGQFAFEEMKLSAEAVLFTLNSPGAVTLEAVDLLGRSINLYSGSFPAGEIRIPYSPTSLLPGLYHFVLHDNWHTLASTKIMISQ